MYLIVRFDMLHTKLHKQRCKKGGFPKRATGKSKLYHPCEVGDIKTTVAEQVGKYVHGKFRVGESYS